MLSILFFIFILYSLYSFVYMKQAKMDFINIGVVVWCDVFTSGGGFEETHSIFRR